MNCEKKIIEAFIQQLNDAQNLNLVITEWPDQVNRKTPDIDAIAKSEKIKIAIEHTSIDVLPNQRKDDSWFYPVVKDLQSELLLKNFNYRITVIVQSYSKSKKYNLTETRKRFKSWLEKNIPILPFGTITIKDDKVPFQFKIIKEDSGDSKIAIGRDIPDDNTFGDRISKILNKKAVKLKQYKNRGFKTVILIENDDIQLMSEKKIFDKLHENNASFEKCTVDEIWYGDSSLKNRYSFWLLSDCISTPKMDYPIRLN